MKKRNSTYIIHSNKEADYGEDADPTSTYINQLSRDDILIFPSVNKQLRYSNLSNLSDKNRILNKENSKSRRKSKNFTISGHSGISGTIGFITKKNTHQLNNSSFLSKNNSVINRMDRIFEKYPELEVLFFGQIDGNIRDQSILKQILSKTQNKLFITDLFCSIANFIVVTWLYFEHFNYMDNNYVITENGNISRIICLCISVLVCIILYYRFYQKAKVEKLRYILNMRNKMFTKKINLKKLTLELGIHVLLPYPGVSYYWEMMIFGKKVIYTINMFLFTLCLIRVYVILKVIKYWNVFTNEKAKRIFKFYNNKNLNLFFYKTNIKYFAKSSVIFIFCSFIYFSALVYKIYEDYGQDKNKFDYLSNCVWFLIQTMTTIGFGDYVPTTMIGRVIGVLCSIIGIFLLSMIIITLLLNTTLDNDAETKAFNNIEIHHTKRSKNNYFTNYFENFIRYKLKSLKKSKGVKLHDYFQVRNRFKIAKEQNYIRIRAGLKERLSVPQFCGNVKQGWEIFYDNILYDIWDNIIKLYPKSAFFADNVLLFTTTMKNSKLNSFKMVNLMRFIELCGSPFQVTSMDDFKGDAICSEKIFNSSMREFYIKNKEKVKKIGTLDRKLMLNKIYLNRTKNMSRLTNQPMNKTISDLSALDHDDISDSDFIEGQDVFYSGEEFESNEDESQENQAQNSL